MSDEKIVLDVDTDRLVYDILVSKSLKISVCDIYHGLYQFSSVIDDKEVKIELEYYYNLEDKKMHCNVDDINGKSIKPKQCEDIQEAINYVNECFNNLFKEKKL